MQSCSHTLDTLPSTVVRRQALTSTRCAVCGGRYGQQGRQDHLSEPTTPTPHQLPIFNCSSSHSNNAQSLRPLHVRNRLLSLYSVVLILLGIEFAAKSCMDLNCHIENGRNTRPTYPYGSVPTDPPTILLPNRIRPVAQPTGPLAIGPAYSSSYVLLHCLVNGLPHWATGYLVRQQVGL
jgi:hypothetical protein